MIEYNCQKCKRRMESPNEHAGIVVDCPYCQAQVRVPGGDVFANLDADEPAPPPSSRSSSKREALERGRKRYTRERDDLDEDEDEEEKPKRERESGSRRGLVVVKNKKPISATALLLAGITVLVVFAGGGVLLWQLMSKKPAQSTEPEKKNEVVEAPKEQTLFQRLVTSSVFIQVKLEGTVVNRNVTAQGTGVVIDKRRKWILTAYHVVDGGLEIKVFFPKYDKNKKLITKIEDYERDDYSAKVIKSDKSKDLAIIQLDLAIPNESQAVQLAAESPEPGDEMHTVGGNPKESIGLWIYSKGNVREVQRDSIRLDNKQMIDAWVVRATNPVNPGDSGGGLYNNNGELVGVCCAINRGANAVSEFIDVREVKALMNKK